MLLLLVLVHLHRILEVPHMTVAKLDLGWSERSGNSTIWKTEEASGEGLNVSSVLQDINEDLESSVTPGIYPYVDLSRKPEPSEL